MTEFTEEQVFNTGLRHGQDHIEFYPPENWFRARYPKGSSRTYERGYVRGLANSYKGDVSPRCPECGYNLDDAITHGDHGKCGGTIPSGWKVYKKAIQERIGV